MTIGRVVVPAVMAALLASTPLATAEASRPGEPSWTDSSRLSGSARLVSIATNGRGEAFSTVLGNGVGGFTRRADGNWNRWVGDDGGAGLWNQAVIDRHGNTTVVWAENLYMCGGFDDVTSWEDEPFTIETAYRPDGGSFRHERLEWRSETCLGSAPALAVDGAGTVTMVFRDSTRIYATQRSAGGRWEDPLLIGRGEHYDVEVAGRSTPVAAWTTPEGQAVSSTRTGPRAWSSPAPVDHAEATSWRALDEVQVVRAPSGALRALWLESDGSAGHQRLRSAMRPVGEGWGEPQTVVALEAGEVIQDPGLSVNDKTTTAVWFQCGSRAACEDRTQLGSVEAASVRNGRWSAPTVLDSEVPWPPPNNEAGPHGAVSSAANSLGVMAMWRNGRHTYAALQQPRGAWARPTQLSRKPARASGPVEVIAYRPDMFTAVFGDGDLLAFADYVDDRVAPTARVTEPRPPFDFHGWTILEWDTADDRTGMATVDVRVRTAGRDGRFTRWSMWLKRVATDQHGLRFKPGQTRCVAVRARDHKGNLGRWSRQHCVTAAVDDRGLARSKGWSNMANREAYESTLTRTRRHGARLTLRGVGARQVSLGARTCPGCGVVTVTHAGQRLGRIDLSSSRVRDRRAFRLKPRARLIRGPVVVRVVSHGKPVQVDSLIARP